MTSDPDEPTSVTPRTSLVPAVLREAGSNPMVFVRWDDGVLVAVWLVPYELA